MDLSCLEERYNRAEDHMKPAVFEHPTASDHRATWKEVQSAMSLPCCGAYKLDCTSDGYCEMESDLYGWVRIPVDDIAWSDLASEILGPLAS